MWRMALVGMLVWTVYAVGEVWLDNAPLAVDLETYGEPWDLRKILAELEKNGVELTVTDLGLVSDESDDLIPTEFIQPIDPVVRAVVELDEQEALLYVHPGLSSLRENWVEGDRGVLPRGKIVFDVHFSILHNVVVVEQGWGRAAVGEALAELDR